MLTTKHAAKNMQQTTTKIYDPDISPGSANQYILGDMYLRSSLSRKLQTTKKKNGVPGRPEFPLDGLCDAMGLAALGLLNSPAGSPRCPLPWIAVSCS